MPATEDYYVNVLAPQDPFVEYDMNCPAIGTKGNNFWKKNCNERKRINNPCVRSCSKNKVTKVQVKSGTTKPYVPKTRQSGTIREKVVLLAKKDMSASEIAKIIDLEPHKVHDHLNKARRFGEL